MFGRACAGTTVNSCAGYVLFAFGVCVARSRRAKLLFDWACARAYSVAKCDSGLCNSMQRRLALQLSLSVCAFFVCAACGPSFGGDAGGQPIEFSKPHTELVTTNLQETASKKIGDTLLRQRIRPDGPRRVEVLDSESGFAIGRPLPPPTVGSQSQRKRLKEYMDRRRNWVFLYAEELGAGRETEDRLGLSEAGAAMGQKEGGSVIERFYQRLKQQNEAHTGRVLPELMDEDNTINFGVKLDEKSPLARKVDETEQTLQNLFKSQPAGDFLPMQDQKSPLSIFPEQPWTTKPYTQSDSDRKSRLDEFKRLLEPSQAVSAGPSPSSALGSFGERGKVSSGMAYPTVNIAPTVPTTPIDSATVNPYMAVPINRPGASTFNQQLNPMPQAREKTALPQPPQGPPQRKF